MRSHPYAAPPPLPPILDEIADELSSILPGHDPRRPASDTEFELGDLDPETSQLLPVRQKRHHVRVQGKLVLVRSISTANLRPPITTRPTSSALSPLGDRTVTASADRPSRYETAVGSGVAARRPRGRRRSLDGSARDDGESETETEEEVRETGIRDRQLRGYGIGGAGNIRRPTEVIHFPARRTGASMMLFSSVMPSEPTSPTSPTTPDKKRWNIREILGLPGDPKGKGRAASP
ncbi:hypothetical protein B0T22DRAFT_462095 [Podospora appendiculata]|uniref:Uncharacterized protein n=1 Tax=Podospora appendiculata TaxID=314037 RepID=A0AAE1CDS6_9PEZI|nr:hypothetical protein B0T22DRAFT_462095 [Podospora appendiculata]